MEARYTCRVDNVRNRHAKGEIYFPTLQDFLEGWIGGPGDRTSLNPVVLCGPYSGEIPFSGDTHRIITQNAFAAYVETRFSSKLTITAGLRYEVSGVIHEQNDLLANFEPNIGFAQVGKQISTPYNVQHNNFAPRLGIAWDPWGDGKTVIHAAAGVMYEIAPYIPILLARRPAAGLGRTQFLPERWESLQGVER